MNAIAFQVDGTPAPKGSTRAFVRYRPGKGYRAIVTNDNRHTRPWAARVRDAAILARHDWIRARRLGVGACLAPMFASGAVRVELAFALPRVTRTPKTRIVPHTCKPDLDKLARAAFDALTGVIWADDAQVTALVVSKRYALVGERPGCSIGVDAFAPETKADAEP